MSSAPATMKYPNRLWRSRKRVGLRQKQVAGLLDSSIAIVSLYEHGMVLPPLQTALMFEEIYRTPLHALYPELVAMIQRRLEEKIIANPVAYKSLVDSG